MATIIYENSDEAVQGITAEIELEEKVDNAIAVTEAMGIEVEETKEESEERQWDSGMF